MSESKNLIAEAMGTFIMVFAGTGAIAIDALFGMIVAAQVFLRFIKCKDPSECKL